jgi:DNA-directed RNA polymerase III subunit RPC3
LNRRQISLGLVTLVQSHLVFHSSAVSPQSAYEIDWQQSYALVRFGKVVKLVEDRFGKNASTVIGNLLEHGHTRIGDLKNALFPPTEPTDYSDDEAVNGNGAGLKRKRTNGDHVNGTQAKVNGTDDATEAGAESGSLKTVDEFYDAIQLLMRQGWIMKVEQTQYLGPGDFHELAEKRALEEVFGGQVPSGTKGKKDLVAETQRYKRAIRDAWAECPQLLFSKRKGNDRDYNQASKRVRVNGGNEWAAGGGGDSSAEENIPIRVNPEKVAVAMRTEQLVRLVEQRLGYTTACIYRVMLRSMESEIPRCFEEWPDPPDPKADMDGNPNSIASLFVTATEVERQTKDLDICEGLDPHTVSKTTGRGTFTNKEIKETKLGDPVDPASLGHHERVTLVDAHIQLLARDPFHFVTWHSRAGYSQWHVEFAEIAKVLIEQDIENTVQARKQTLGLKLIRALKKKGKLDERQACNAMMMSATEMRGVVNDLTVQGFVQTQEIPRVERREAKHSLHLFWYDRQRAREKLLHDTYKGMIRIMQRIAYEKSKVQDALAKAERTDVVGNESKYLTREELTALNEWKTTEEKLLLQLAREDDLVAVLRDFHGPLISS